MTPLRLLMGALALACLAFAACFFHRQVLERDRTRELRQLLAQQDLPEPRVVLLHPVEDFVGVIPDLDLLADRLVPVSIHERVLPLFPLRGVPNVYLLTSAYARPRSNLTEWPQQLVARSPHLELWRLPLQIDSLQHDFDRLQVARVIAGAPRPARREEGLYRIGDRGWQVVKLEERFVDEERYRCLAVHPEPGYAVRLTWPLPAPGRRVQVHLSMGRTGTFHKGYRYGLSLQLLDREGRPLQTRPAALWAPQLRRWRTVEIDAQGGSVLQVDLDVNLTGRHHLCLMGDLLR